MSVSGQRFGSVEALPDLDLCDCGDAGNYCFSEVDNRYTSWSPPVTALTFGSI
jgi:hypothetical protein